MPQHRWARLTPREGVAALCARRGRAAVIAGCVRLIEGDYGDEDLIVGLVGGIVPHLLDGREHHDVYWFRVWGVRGLLYAFDDSATAAVGLALTDEAWRVREMGAKVIARHRVGELFAAVAQLREDAVPRVRGAACRAVAVLTAEGA